MIETEIKVTPQMAAEHGLTADEYARIQKILGREPNITELGIFSVMWSEHCSYKSSRVHLKKLPTTGARVVRGREKTRAWWTSATGWWRCSRSSRTTIRASSSRFRARRRAWAESCGIFSRWGRGRLRCSIRCGLGRLPRGKAPRSGPSGKAKADREIEDRDRAEPANSRRRGARDRILRELLWSADGGGRGAVRAVLFE